MDTEQLERDPGTCPGVPLLIFHMATGAADSSSPAHMADAFQWLPVEVLALARSGQMMLNTMVSCLGSFVYYI